MKRVAAVAAVALVVAVPAAATSTGLVPLTELGRGRYHGFTGGLYPGGRNAPSARYLAKGLAAAKAVKPIGGKIVLLSIGMSNTTQEFSVFKRLADADPRKNPHVLIVDGAQGGQDAVRISSPDAPFWTVVDRRLQAVGATRRHVQVVWLKQAYARPTEAFPADARRLQSALRKIHGILADRFPNLRLVYLSSRTYAGYASTEPYAYQTGFAVKWTVQDRIEGKLEGPWMGWGPYLWADGMRTRKDGLTWRAADFGPDGTHPSESGRRKVADLLVRFFTTDRTARSWFVDR